MLARASDLWRLAASSWALLSAISRNSLAFWMARADWSIAAPWEARPARLMGRRAKPLKGKADAKRARAGKSPRNEGARVRGDGAIRDPAMRDAARPHRPRGDIVGGLPRLRAAHPGAGPLGGASTVQSAR